MITYKPCPDENVLEIYDSSSRHIGNVLLFDGIVKMAFNWRFERVLSFDDVKVIQDGWDELQKLRRKNEKCPDCGLQVDDPSCCINDEDLNK